MFSFDKFLLIIFFSAKVLNKPKYNLICICWLIDGNFWIEQMQRWVSTFSILAIRRICQLRLRLCILIKLFNEEDVVRLEIKFSYQPFHIQDILNKFQWKIFVLGNRSLYLILKTKHTIIMYRHHEIYGLSRQPFVFYGKKYLITSFIFLFKYEKQLFFHLWI